MNRWRMRRRTLARFLQVVNRSYRPLPYHNWSHAFSAMHFAFLLCRRMPPNYLTYVISLSFRYVFEYFPLDGLFVRPDYGSTYLVQAANAAVCNLHYL